MVYTGKISAEQRARVWFLKENKGLSLRKIAWKCEISKSSVAQICDRTSNQRSQVDKVYCKVCFDGVSFVHKQNPPQAAAGTRSWIWRKKKEGPQFTAKGSKHLAGGPRLHLIVAIAHGKGVVLKKVYEKTDGQLYPHFIWTHFKVAFAQSGPKWHGHGLFIFKNFTLPFVLILVTTVWK